MNKIILVMVCIFVSGCSNRNTSNEGTSPTEEAGDAAREEGVDGGAGGTAADAGRGSTPAADGGEVTADAGSEQDGAAATVAVARPERVELGEGAAEALAKASNTFAFDLYGQLRREPGNLAFSPASIVVALSMTWAGARGQTAAQMAKTLHLPGDQELVHGAAANLLHDWNDPERSAYELRVVNRLFAEKTYAIEDDFLSLTKQRYAAPLEPVDFISDFEGSRRHINDWVATQTNDRIQDLLPAGSITDMTRLVLTNAVYFLGQWSKRFDESRTRDHVFWADGTRDVEVPFMEQTQSFRYAELDGGTKVLEMPYRGDELAMMVVLPGERDGLSALEAALDVAQLEAWTGALASKRVIVTLPRFTVDPSESFGLKEILSRMGMPLAFSRQADLTGIAAREDPAEELHISNVYHKAFVAVNEEGTEAAAATAVVTALCGAAPPPEQPAVFRADHPFLFLIRDLRRGTILFIGRVVDPS